MLPEDVVPDALNMQEVEDPAETHTLNCDTFCDWLREGKYTCNIAQSMWHVWAAYLSDSAQDTLYDFCKQLLDAYIDTLLPDERFSARQHATFTVGWLLG